jgi:hypothetical protein
MEGAEMNCNRVKMRRTPINPIQTEFNFGELPQNKIRDLSCAGKPPQKTTKEEERKEPEENHPGRWWENYYK